MANLTLDKNELIDWFRVITDIERAGIPTRKLAEALDIPPSTMMGWKLDQCRPRFEEALRVLNAWCKVTRKRFDAAPRYNPTRPDLRFTKTSPAARAKA